MTGSVASIVQLAQRRVGSNQVEFAAAGYVIDVQAINIGLAAMGFEDPGP
jgi:hypothetical protein